MLSKTALKIYFSLGLICILAFNINFSDLRSSASDFDIRLVGLSIFCIICQIFFLNLRWHLYMNEGHTKVPFHRSVLINIAGYFANIVFISSIGGIIAKSGLALREGLSLTRAIFITFLDRFMSISALLFFSVCGLPFLLPTLDHKLGLALTLSIFVIIAAIVIAIILLRTGLFKKYIFASRKRVNIVAILRS